MEPLALAAIAVGALGAGGLVYLAAVTIPFRPPGHAVTAATLSVAPSMSGRERLVAVAPRGYVAWLERQIMRAGKSTSWSAGGFVLAHVLGAAFGVLVVWLAVMLSRGVVVAVALAVVFAVLLAIAPAVIAWSRADDRQRLITEALPDTLDQMTIATEAGLGFDAALQKAAQNGRGPLAEELIRTLQDQSIGMSRRAAYSALEARTGSEDLRRFIRAIAQADAFGISVADVLRVQAKELRVKRRQRAQEQAMKVPVKVVFPLVLCILPVLFIVILSPAVVGIIATYSQL